MLGTGYQPDASEHAGLRAALENHLATEADDAPVRAELAILYLAEYQLLFNPLPDPLGRARQSARRAIELDSGNQQGWVSLAVTSFHRHDEHGLAEAAERAIKVNPRNSNALAWIGNILTCQGEYERGVPLTERAMAINASHSGWYHFGPFNRHFARKDFTEALKAARRVNIADFMWMHLAIAAAAGHLGRAADAKAAVDALASLAPQLVDEANLREFVTRWFWEEDFIESLLIGVQRAKQLTDAPDQ